MGGPWKGHWNYNNIRVLSVIGKMEFWSRIHFPKILRIEDYLLFSWFLFIWPAALVLLKHLIVVHHIVQLFVNACSPHMFVTLLPLVAYEILHCDLHIFWYGHSCMNWEILQDNFLLLLTNLGSCLHKSLWYKCRRRKVALVFYGCCKSTVLCSTCWIIPARIVGDLSPKGSFLICPRSF